MCTIIRQTSIHHTSTHLLHSYLRQYLYKYSTNNSTIQSLSSSSSIPNINFDLSPIQAGSSVDSNGLRFDYVNKYNIDPKQLNAILSCIEKDINQQIQERISHSYESQ